MDNDLPHTDCCPGCGSVAKYIAVSTREAARKHDMSESAVKVAVHRGMKALGARFGGAGGD